MPNVWRAGRTQLFVASAEGAHWGFYDAAGLPSLVAWLEGGSDAEQETAERVYEAFAPALRAAAADAPATVMPFFLI